MKVNELMLGDWVNYSILNINSKVVSIIGNHTITIQFVDKNNKVGVIHGLLEETINPIPITSDILVKNGFDKDERSKYFHVYTLNIKGSYDFDISWSSQNGFSYEDIKLTYVHQLQRLLNLCNIDKEIIL